MKKISLALIILIIAGICISAVSAETILDKELTTYEDTSGESEYGSYSTTYEYVTKNNLIIIKTIEKHQYVPYIAITRNKASGDVFPAEGEHDITYTMFGETKPAHMYITHYSNAFGTVTAMRALIFFEDWDVGTHTGPAQIELSEGPFRGRVSYNGAKNGIAYLTDKVSSTYYLNAYPYKIAIISTVTWDNHLLVETYPGDSYKITLTRDGDASTIAFLLNSDTIFSNFGTDNRYFIYRDNEIDSISINTSFGENYLFDIGSSGEQEGPVNSSVTVYVRNSQTGAAIANSRCVIDALVDGDYYPVVNRTEPSGVFSVTLQPTGGGTPNPDGYRLIASADGYNNPMPEINFTVDEYTTSIYCYLDPIAGGPLDENKTFIDIFVRDMSANPISGATVNFGGYTLLTNSHGYTVFEVGKNATYTYTVSKSGYGSLTGNVVIGADSRHTINTVLAPAVTPTTQTPIPTGTAIGPTPTMTAPTGEPVSNWLEWFAAHLGMILGGGVEIGKIFMWLCFSVPVGVYVGKESKAGAAGFLAGAGIVTLFFVLIGWVPIWLLVLLALIIGLLYAKVFNSSDTGGGR